LFQTATAASLAQVHITKPLKKYTDGKALACTMRVVTPGTRTDINELNNRSVTTKASAALLTPEVKGAAKWTAIK